ncbi:MAG: AMP-binding protein, partial [Bacteroidia bacterium]|nr:AMP-binding protein [Bacteroidia bacterium]
MTNKEYANRFLKDWDNGERIFTLTTSGSTGIPKNIELKREFLEISAKATADHLHLDSRENIFCCLPVNKMGGLMMLVRAKVLGCNIEICDPVSDPMVLLDEFHKFTFVSLVPLQLYEIFKNQESINKLNRFKNVLIGGAEIDKQLELKVRQLHVTAWHTYGMTETYSHIALRKLNGSETSDYFTPMEGVTIKRDERGCLMIKAVVTNNEFIITNDLAEINKEGNFKISGRFDLVINSGGN